jgi:hypothetical protein
MLLVLLEVMEFEGRGSNWFLQKTVNNNIIYLISGFGIEYLFVGPKREQKM